MPYIIQVYHKSGKSTVKVSEKRGFLHGELMPVDSQNMVHLSLSRTINLGDYNSMKVEISVDQVYDHGKLEQTYNTLSTWLSSKFVDTVKSIAP